MQTIVIDIKAGFINGIGGLSDEQEVIIRDYDVSGINEKYLLTDEKGNVYFEEIWNSTGCKS